MSVARFFFIVSLFALISGCSLAGADEAAGGWEAPVVPLLRPIAFTADAAPAVGETAQLSAAFRFVRASDSPFIAENGFDRLVDSLYAAHGPLWVEGIIEFYPYRKHSAVSQAVRLVGGTGPLGRPGSFAGAVTPADTVRLSAAFVPIVADTVMAVATLRVYSSQAEAAKPVASWGGGFKHACFVVRERDGLALGDCWETTPSR